MSSKAKTIIRLKRKREDDPLDAFLVSEDPKRRLTESAVFSLVESVSSKEFQTLFPRVPPKPSLAHNLERKRAVLSSKKIEEAREARYKIIESNRNFSVGTETYTLIDVTKHTIKETVTVESISNLVQDMDVDESKYVYDIYYHDSERPVHDVLNQRVGTFDLQFEDPLDGDESSQDPDSEDSNAENYYGNDYPDEESDEENVYTRYSDDADYEDEPDYAHD